MRASAIRASALFLSIFTLFVWICPAAPPQGHQSWDTENGLPQNTVQAILQTSDGYLWFATEGGLARFDSQRFTIFNVRNTPQLRSNDVRALFQDTAGVLWIAGNGGLTSFFHDKFQSYTTEKGLPSNAVSSLFLGPARTVCATTDSGAACFSAGRFVASSLTAPKRPPIDSAWRTYVSSPILCSYKDREGNVWLGTEDSGITVLRPLHFQSFSNREDGMDGQIRCVFRDREGAIWFGGGTTGLVRYRDGKFNRLTTADGLSSDIIVSLGQDTNGDLLIGTPDGLNRLHDRQITIQTSADGLPDDFIRSIYTDISGNVWLGTRRGLVLLHAGTFQTYTHADGLGNDLIGTIVRDRSGVLWVATLGGLSRLNGRRFENFTTANGLASNVITALYVDPANVLWIGTQGAGLSRLINNKFERLSGRNLPDTVYGITQDASENFWIASDTGIYRFNFVTDEVVGYGVSDGLRVYECSGGGHPALARTPDGAVWFATLRGASLLLPDAPFNSIPPPVVVDGIKIDNHQIPVAASVKVAAGASRIEFNYAALSFRAPQKVRYLYRLNGFDKVWNDAGNVRNAVYTNLNPGRYAFHVIARNGDGVWNKTGADVTVILEPHFYQTWWFASILLVALILCGYGAYQWRVARVASQMESRFEAVLGERNRIAREIHDTLAQGFAGVSVQLELVSRRLGLSPSDLSRDLRDPLDQARMLVRTSLAEARRSIWELRSQSSDIDDFAKRLSKMASQMSGRGRPEISVQVRGTFRPLSPRTEDELLRISQEAVTNAVRHAEASRIDIELAFDPKFLSLTVADNGRGFEPAIDTGGIAGHFGLQGMHERAAGMNATLEVETAPGAGTRLSLRVPV